MNNIDQKQLRAAVHLLHEQAEHTNIAQGLINGSIDPVKYKNLCFQLYLIADFIESKVQLPSTLQRRTAFVKDVAECPPAKVTAAFSTINYLNYLAGLGTDLKGHLYAHYLGWLYGGQMIAKKLDLPKHHLAFENVKESVDYMRNSLLTNLTSDDAEEAKRAFEFIIAIYKEVDELS
jgi:heme oxygenase